MIAFGVVIGIILSFVIGLLLINPIKKLQSAMNEVAEGDLTITIEEKSLFDEIENINHSFNIMMKELRSNQMVQKDFISNVAHEFKTPLSTIDGYITLLQDESLSVEERNEYARIILETTASMSELVGNILLLSKTSNQGIVVDKNNFSLDEQIRKVVVLLEPKWSAKNIDFDVDLEEISVLSNENLMFNVWRNLIENAVKFTKESTKITLSLKTENDKIVFKVLDQGDGIDEDDKKYIFNKFYQADTSHKQEGNGLGLALVKDILTLFGGDIQKGNVAFKVLGDILHHVDHHGVRATQGHQPCLVQELVSDDIQAPLYHHALFGRDAADLHGGGAEQCLHLLQKKVLHQWGRAKPRGGGLFGIQRRGQGPDQVIVQGHAAHQGILRNAKSVYLKGRDKGGLPLPQQHRFLPHLTATFSANDQ
jgi:signal transduction histidine kinase